MRVTDGYEEYEVSRNGCPTSELLECICSACGNTYDYAELRPETTYSEYWGVPDTHTVRVSPCCGEGVIDADDLTITEEE